MPPRDRQQEQRTQWARLAGMGFEFGASVAVFTLVGWWVDYRWRIEGHWGTLIGALLGLIGGGYNFMREALKALRESEREARDRRDRTAGKPDDTKKDERGSDA